MMAKSDIMKMDFINLGWVISYNPDTRLGVVQQLPRRLNNGDELESPVIYDVPFAFPVFDGGSGWITHPVKPGDPVLLLHNQRSIEDWVAGNVKKAPEDPRIMDLNDCFAQPIGHVHLPIQTDGTCIHMQYGPTQIQIYKDNRIHFKGDITHEGNYTQTGNLKRTGNSNQEGSVTLKGDSAITGNTNQTGNYTGVGEVIANGIPLSKHKHQDTKQEKGSVSGDPIP